MNNNKLIYFMQIIIIVQDIVFIRDNILNKIGEYYNESYKMFHNFGDFNHLNLCGFRIPTNN